MVERQIAVHECAEVGEVEGDGARQASLPEGGAQLKEHRGFRACEVGVAHALAGVFDAGGMPAGHRRCRYLDGVGGGVPGRVPPCHA